jgi:hypothetical protein
LVDPKLSIIVTITDGAPNLGRCLRALEAQQGGPPAEILVPVHPALDDMKALEREHPRVRFVPIENLPFSERPSDPGLRHIVYDYRRSAGLRAARGEVIAMTEDHAIPPPDWSKNLMACHSSAADGAIGGAIDPGCSTYLSWAAYFGEFSRYQNPVREGPAQYVSDVNVSYKRPALELVRAIWQESFHETAVHRGLVEAGETISLSRLPVIRHDRGELSLGPMCRERIAWARIFAGRRVRTVSSFARFAMAALTPAIPAVFMLRQWGIVLRTRRSGGRLLLAMPILFVLYSFWAYGEFLGYLTGRDTRKSLPENTVRNIGSLPHRF